METVEAAVAQVQALSGNFDDASHLNALLKQSEDSLRLKSTALAPYLYQLDPSTHSVGYLYFLEAFLSTPISKEKANEVVALTIRFIRSCNAVQIRLAPDKFISICKRLKEQVMLLETPIRGVAASLTAIRKIQPCTEHLTSLHPDFILLCVLSKCYKTGLQLLEDGIFEMDQPKDLFLYFYYGKCYHTGVAPKVYGGSLCYRHTTNRFHLSQPHSSRKVHQ